MNVFSLSFLFVFFTQFFMPLVSMDQASCELDDNYIQTIEGSLPAIILKGCDVSRIDIKEEIRSSLYEYNSQLQYEPEDRFKSVEELAADVCDENHVKKNLFSNKSQDYKNLFQYQEVLNSVVEKLEKKIVEQTAPDFIEGMQKVLSGQIADMDLVHSQRFQFVRKYGPRDWYKKTIEDSGYFFHDSSPHSVVRSLYSAEISKGNTLGATKNAAKLLLSLACDSRGRVSCPGGSLLHRAIGHNIYSLVEILVELGADVNKSDESGKSPLYAAVSQTHSSKSNDRIVGDLIAAGAHIDGAYGEFQGNLLDVASKRSHLSLSLVRILIRAGVNVNGTSNIGVTPLHHACSLGGRDRIAAELLIAGADVNARTAGGRTSLHKVLTSYAYVSSTKSALLLIKAGADEKIKDASGYTALDCAGFLDSPRAVTRLEVIQKALSDRDISRENAAMSREDNALQDIVQAVVETKKRKREYSE